MNDIPRKKTKDKIMAAAWELFISQGYEETTISQIIEKSATSRSAFYHHFHGKEELLFSLAYSYDDDYDVWLADCNPSLHAVDKLISFNCFVMENLENSPYITLFPALYGLQVTTPGFRHILNPDRRYYRILHTLLKEGQEKGEIAGRHSYAELADVIANMQIGITYAWCLQQKRFSLLHYGQAVVEPFLETLRQ